MAHLLLVDTNRNEPRRPVSTAPKKGNCAMSRFRPVIALAILLALLALPAAAVTSSRTNQNRAEGFFSALWSAITSLISTDGRCGADPWGCPSVTAAGTPLVSTDGHCSLDPDGRCIPG